MIELMTFSGLPISVSISRWFSTTKQGARCACINRVHTPVLQSENRRGIVGKTEGSEVAGNAITRGGMASAIKVVKTGT